MKTKMKVRRNDRPTAKEMEVRRAIHVLQDACEDGLVLMHDRRAGVYLIPSILPGDGDRPEGTVEYQVSDGPVGKRSGSYDFYKLEDAIKHYKRIVKDGWKWQR